MASKKEQNALLLAGVFGNCSGEANPIIMQSNGVITALRITPKRKRKYVPPISKIL